MTSQALQEARKYEEMTEAYIAPDDRPAFHLSSRVGRMNLAPDGRRIEIGWLQNRDLCNMRSQPKNRFGQMSLPRELSVKTEGYIRILSGN